MVVKYSMFIMTNSIWFNIQQWRTARFLWNNVIQRSKWKNVVFFISVLFRLNNNWKTTTFLWMWLYKLNSSSKLPSSRAVAFSVHGWISKGGAYVGDGRETTQCLSWHRAALEHTPVFPTGGTYASKSLF